MGGGAVTRIVVVADDQAGGEIAAGIIADRVGGRAGAVLGVATGSTPLTTWAALRRRGPDLSRVTAFALDEYLGLPLGHPQSFAAVVDREITRPLGLDPERVHVPSAKRGDPALAAARYERAIVAAGGVDVQVLGIGRNGHLAFNEPGSPLHSTTRVTRLSAETRRDNARFFSSPAEVPTEALTQGLGTIARARTLVLLAFGEHKAPALTAAIEGPVGPQLPASIIQLHPDAVVIADQAAASRLARAASA
jgi:glucosamine-6-phosphate deaminase